MFTRFFISIYFVVLLKSASSSSQKPHIVLIIADDLGWNDVGFHGSNEIPTPNIDALAYNGLILNRHYTLSSCTPSRAALLTGKYPIRMGLQRGPIVSGVPESVPLEEKLIPQYLKELGYQTRLVGKWHVGSYRKECTPTERGFDSFFGSYNGWVRYNDSVSGSIILGNMTGIDARINHEKAGDRFYQRYITDVHTEEAIDIIQKHNRSVPLFLDISFTAVHAIIKNTVQVRNVTETEQMFAYIADPNRRMFAGALTALDESVGKIIQALHKSRMLSNSIVIFMSDNGGATLRKSSGWGGVFQNFPSNWPLRGVKSALAEGAVRCAAAIWSPLIRRGEVMQEKIHLVDWLPTFLTAAGGNISHIKEIDGVSQWDYLTNGNSTAPRHRLLVNIDEITDEKAFIMGKWKYIKSNKNVSLQFGGYAGRDNDLLYNLSLVSHSPTNEVLKKYRYKNKRYNENQFLKMRRKANVALQGFCKNRTQSSDSDVLSCFQKGCLFNIKNDPCEMIDLSAKYPNKLKNLQKALLQYERLLIPQQNCTKDERANPINFDNYWTPWLQAQPRTCVFQ